MHSVAFADGRKLKRAGPGRYMANTITFFRMAARDMQSQDREERVVRFYDPDGNLIEVGTPV